MFISSTAGALVPYRLAAVEVCHRLGLTPVHMEEFDPQRPTPEHVCRSALESCDVYILLLAHRYGARPPGQQLSYTELEYRWATARPDMPMLGFVVDPAFPWPPPDIAQGADADALARFKTQVLTDHVVRPLGELAAFREDLMLALGRVQREWTARNEPESQKAEQADAPHREYWVPMPPAFHAVPPYVGGAPFTGRAADLSTLDDWARSSDPVMVIEALGGTGKSALAWEWTQQRAPATIDGLAGRLWWSFYEGSASMTRFLRELLAYTSPRPMREIRELDRADLADEALASLRQRPYLIVLDGFERLLAAYHRFDPSKLRDDEVEPDKRSLIEPQAEEIVRRLVTAAGPSKILVSTRLMPTALQGRFGQRLPGVRQLRLPGLTDSDTQKLLADLDVHGSKAAVTGFFGPLGNHPLLIGIVAGLVRDYRSEPGGFDRWLTDPTAGGALRLPDLNLSQRRAHILATALDGLEPGSRQLLGWISVLAGAVSWTTLEAINPFRPEPPLPDIFAESLDEPTYGEWQAVEQARMKTERQAQEELAAWQTSEPVMRAPAQLGAALKDLEDRGLLWWDRSSNTYDLHPIIRAYAHEQLEDTDRVQANDRIRDHFEALPPEDTENAASVEDLSQTITIFRALIGAGHVDEANLVWSSLNRALLVKMGAYATTAELLAPIATDQSDNTLGMRNNLAIAHSQLGHYEEAIKQTTDVLSNVLRNGIQTVSDGLEFGVEGAVKEAQLNLNNLSTQFQNSGALVAAGACLELSAALSAAADTGDDGSMILPFAAFAAIRGDVKQARDLIDQARTIGPPVSYPWLAGDVENWQLFLALVADRSLTHSQIDEAATRVESWTQRHNLAGIRRELFIREGQYAPALTVVQEDEQLCRNAGLNVTPACSAFLLAKLGRTEQAEAAAEDALASLNRSHRARRPHYYLALALWELGRADEAREHARHAYRQAWADGPPYCRYWDLRDARELLDSMGEPYPDVEVTDPATVRVPLEDEIRALIATLEERQGPG